MMSGNRKKTDPPQDIALPITPMLDMAFQLLMFFIFTYNPSALEGQMDLALPAKQVTQAPNQAEVNQKAESHKEADDIDVPLDLNVRVHAHEVGYTMSLEEGSAINTPMDNLTALTEHLKKTFKDKAVVIFDKLKGLESAERDQALRDELRRVAIKVQGDSKLAWKHVVEVMDACRSAGVKAFEEAAPDEDTKALLKRLNVVNVSFAAPPDQNVGQ